MKNKNASCKIYFEENKCYKQILNCDIINFYEDRFEVKCIFNKKGKYKVELFGNKDGGAKTYKILIYIILVKKNIRRELEFPKYFNESKLIKIIEPLYNNIKSGDKVKFKIKSNLNKIILYYLKYLLYFTMSWIHIVLDFGHFLYKKKAFFQHIVLDF